ncbi:MAG: hypothetical protein Q4C12_03950 [Clostridia bacterium]|nr:hypothetical protein [Clostridia bacterium]
MIKRKLCILDDEKICDGCGECERCDIDPNKSCDNCGKCIGIDMDSRAILIDDVIIDTKAR